MKTCLLLILLLIVNYCPAQELSISQASMSSSDRKLDILQMGNTDKGALVLISQSGNVLLYDGYEVSTWNNVNLKLPHLVESVFLKDSSLYFTTKDALLLYNPASDKPQLLQKASHKFFLEDEGSILYYSDNEWFELKGDKLVKSSANKNKRRDNFPKFIELESKESIRIQNDMIVWSDQQGQLINTLEILEPSTILADSWNQIWLINNKKLSRVTLLRHSENSTNFHWNDQAPQSLTKKDNITLATYSGNTVIRWNNSTPKILWNKIDGLTSIFLDDKLGSWAISKDRVHYSNKDYNFSWDRDDIKLLGTVVSILDDSKTISIVTKNNGIIQTRINPNQEDWIWVPYRYNSKVKNLQIIDAAYRDKTYLFSESFGVFVLDKQEVSILTKNFPSMGILEVDIQKDNAFLMDKGKRFHRFSFGRKSLFNFPQNTILQEPRDYSFMTSNAYVIYNTEAGLCVADPLEGDFEIFDSKVNLKNSIIDGYKLLSFGTKPMTFQVPTNIVKKPGPRIDQVTLTTQSGAVSLLANSNSAANIKLTNEDFPIKLQASCIYLDDPKKIEYAWKTSNDQIIDDFQFSNSIKMRLGEAPEGKWKLVAKVKDLASEQQLNSIEIEYLAKKEDYRWAIYLSAILAALLLIIIIFSKWRSQNQKRKIQTLKLEKKALELEQKALQLQLNPHFVFNALNGVKGMIALGDAKKARQYLTKISTLMRTMLNDARTNKISINSEANMLESYLEIEQELRDFSWKYEVLIDESVNDQLLIPPMMIQPFVENAIIHAFPQKTSDGFISIRFSRIGPKIQITVEDNGVGLQNKTSNHQSVALQLIQDRLKHLNEGTKQTDFSLENKSDHNDTNHGVRVKVLLPILS